MQEVHAIETKNIGRGEKRMRYTWPDDLLKDLLDKSYQLVLGGFSKKKQKEILETWKE